MHSAVTCTYHTAECRRVGDDVSDEGQGMNIPEFQRAVLVLYHHVVPGLERVSLKAHGVGPYTDYTLQLVHVNNVQLINSL